MDADDLRELYWEREQEMVERANKEYFVDRLELRMDEWDRHDRKNSSFQ